MPIARSTASFFSLAALGATLAACPSATTPPPPPDVAPPPPGARAVLADAQGIFALSPEDGTRTPLVDQPVSWCRADPRSGALWYTTAAADMGAEDQVWRYTLWVRDLEQADAAPLRLATLPTPELALVWPDESIGVPMPHTFQVLAALELGATPKIVPRLGCEDDMSWYCYTSEDAEGKPLLSDELVALQRTLAETALAHPDAVAALAQRGATRRFYLPPPPAVELPKVLVPSPACDEIPEDCGRAVPIPGTDLQAVVVGNTRGDFFYEQHRLYDPTTKRFVDPLRPTAAAPDEDAVLEALAVAPGGRYWLDGAHLVDRTRGVVAEGERTCGWTVPAFVFHP